MNYYDTIKYDPSRWQSKIMVNKVFHHVGLFTTPEEAHAAYLVKKRQLHAGCTI